MKKKIEMKKKKIEKKKKNWKKFWNLVFLDLGSVILSSGSSAICRSTSSRAAKAPSRRVFRHRSRLAARLSLAGWSS